MVRDCPRSLGLHEAMSGALPLGVMGRDPETKPREPFLGSGLTGIRMASSGFNSPVSHCPICVCHLLGSSAFVASLNLLCRTSLSATCCRTILGGWYSVRPPGLAIVFLSRYASVACSIVESVLPPGTSFLSFVCGLVHCPFSQLSSGRPSSPLSTLRRLYHRCSPLAIVRIIL